ncbi:cytochrome P450 [Aureobasidium pullulans]|uniref:Cytochrome P450 n=1 Tax=Aureobasidium pullulans TaxID=5580 RepID=A0A4S9ZB62_AURPU|nr:cytochrome P450 [Aureobasidium pullulans]TIA01695.1 cytochrome P450 [Aureobasidium pullulans]
MVDSCNPGALMWLLLVVPFRAPCWPHCPSPCHSTIGLRSSLRLVAILYTSFALLISFYNLRASPKCGLFWLFSRAGIHTLLTVAAVAEACQGPSLTDLRAYHDLLIQSLMLEFLILLCVREVLNLCVRIPGPLLAKSTFIWNAWHLVRGTYEQAVLEAHQTYGAVVRVAPNTYSVSRDCSQLDARFELHPCDYYSPHIALIRIFRHCSNHEHVLSQASANEPAIDACIEGLIEKLAASMDKEGLQVSKLLTCFGWDVMSAIITGDQYGFVDSPDAAVLADILARSRVESIWDGSFFRFHPVVAKMTAWFVPRASNTEWLSLSKVAMARRYMTDDNGNDLETATKAMQDHLNRKSEFLHTEFGIHCSPPDYHYFSVLSFLMGTADPIVVYLQTTMTYLACHPDAQIKVRAEAGSSLSEDDLSLQHLLDLSSRLPYLNAVLRESDRLTATEGIVLNQCAEEPVETQGCRIPAGSTIRLTRSAAGRDRSLFGDDMDRWDPSRWLNKEIAVS